MTTYKVTSEGDWEGHSPGAIVTDPDLSEETLAVVVKLGLLTPTTKQTEKEE